MDWEQIIMILEAEWTFSWDWGFMLSAIGYRLSAIGFWLLAFGFWLLAKIYISV